MRRSILRWYRHVLCKEMDNPVKLVSEDPVKIVWYCALQGYG